jgi:DNA N-6-adenine-methyltransferase (Dam)
MAFEIVTRSAGSSIEAQPAHEVERDLDALLTVDERPGSGVCWMNPLYGRQIAAWVKNAYHERLRCTRVARLLPTRIDTGRWHDHVMRAREIRFLRGRLTFGGAASPVPFSSAVVIFDRGCRRAAPRARGWDWRAAVRPRARSNRKRPTPLRFL